MSNVENFLSEFLKISRTFSCSRSRYHSRIFLIMLFVYCISTNIIYCISCDNFYQLYILMPLAYVFSIVLSNIFVVEKIKTLTKLQYGRLYLHIFGWNNTYCKRHEKKDITNIWMFIYLIVQFLFCIFIFYLFKLNPAFHC